MHSTKKTAKSVVSKKTFTDFLFDNTLTFPEKMQKCADLIPNLFQDPQNISVKITVVTQEYFSDPFTKKDKKVEVAIESQTGSYGAIEIYIEDKKEFEIISQKNHHSSQLKNIAEMIADQVEMIAQNDILHENADTYRLLTENSIDVLWIMDSLLTFKFASPSVFQLTGFTQDEWIGTNLSDHASRKEFLSMARQAIKSIKDYKNQKAVYIQAHIIKKNGDEIPVEIVSRLLVSKNGFPTGVLGSARDISDRIKNENALRENETKYFDSILQLYESGIKLGESLDLDEIYANLYEIMTQTMDCKGMIISSYDSEKKEFVCENMWHEGKQLDVSAFPPIPLEPVGKGTQSRVIHTGAGFVLNDYQAYQRESSTSYYVNEDGIFEEKEISKDENVTSSAILVPLKREQKVIGVLQATSYKLDAYTDQNLKFLEALSPQIAAAISNANLHAESEQARRTILQSLEGTIFTLAKTIETRDPYTAGHQERVAELVAAIAKKMNYSLDQVMGLRMAAIVHDIGKIQVPIEILSKPGKLNEMEFALIQAHPKVACDLLSEIEFPWPIAEYIVQHHEKIDGSGYPFGLMDSDILPESKILAVADIVEAMSSHRPYRPALGIDAALQEIRSQSGRSLDKAVVDACLAVFKDGFQFKSTDIQ